MKKNIWQTGIFALCVMAVVGGLSWWVNHHSSPQINTNSNQSQASEGTEKALSLAQQKLQKSPQDVKSYIGLASAYLQKIRETADVSLYVEIEDLMDQAAKIDPQEPKIFGIRSSVAAGKHDFSKALEFAQTAHDLSPNEAAYFGMMGDAQLELGQYDQAKESFQHMVDIRPDFSSYSRISYFRELNGDTKGAKQAMKQAITAGSSFAENIAWAYVELGKLVLHTDVPAAKKDFEHALALYPDFPPALEGLGRVAVAQGDLNGAILQFQQAFQTLPLAQYAIDLGNAYVLNNQADLAQSQFTLAQAAFDTSAQGGVHVELEEALFFSDHDLKMDAAVQLAEEGYQERPSVFGADVLAWTYFKANRLADAQKLLPEALRLGEYDALTLFHAAKISLAAGDTEQAKQYLILVQHINPNFSVQYDQDAKKTLDTL